MKPRRLFIVMQKTRLMSRGGSSLKRGAVESIFLRISGTALLFLMHWLLAKKLGANEYGIFSFVVSFGTLVAAIASFGWPTLIMRFIPQYLVTNDWALLKGVVRRAFVIVLLSSCVIAVCVWTYSFQNEIYYWPALLVPLMALGGYRKRAFIGLSNVRGSIIPDEILIPSLAILVVGFDDVSGKSFLFSYFLVYLLATLYGLVWLYRTFPKAAKDASAKYKTKEWARIAFPLFLVATSQMLMNQAGSLVLGIQENFHAVGLFSMAFKVSLLITFVMTAVNIIGTPKLTSAYYKNDVILFYRLYKVTMLWSCLGGLPVFIFLVSFPEYTMSLFGDEFAQGSSVLIVLAIGQMINALSGLAGSVVVTAGKEKIFSRVFMIMTTIQIVAGYFASIKWGALGMAYATTLSVTVINVLPLYYVFYKLSWVRYGEKALSND